MFHSVATSSVYLCPSAANILYNNLEINLIGVSPFLVNFYPENILNYENLLTQVNYKLYKPYKIEYNFGDNSEIITKNLTPAATNSFGILDTENQNIPFKKETGDPRNFPVSHLFSLTESTSTIYNGQIKVQWFSTIESQTDYLTYSLNVSVLPPKLNPSVFSNQGLFEDVHLHSIRMFGSDDTVLYNFESANPNFLMPVLVKWPTYSESPYLAPKSSLPPNAKYEWRGYNLKAPFEK